MSCGSGGVVVEQWRMCIVSLYNVLIMWSDNKCVNDLSVSCGHCSVCRKSVVEVKVV